MIFDLLTHIERYKSLSANIAKGIDFILESNLHNLPVGKHQVIEDVVFASVSLYETREYNASKWEAHEKYIDIQLISEGSEKIFFHPVNQMESIAIPYDSNKDVAFFKGSGDFVTVKPGSFVILFPSDAHQPCIINEKHEQVKKIVLKVMV